MYVEKILKLPGLVYFEGITFEMKIIREQSFELTLCYQILVVEKSSPHYATAKNNCWHNSLIGDNKYFCNYLYSAEGIWNDAELKQAIEEVYEFLKENNLLKT